jgi:hypothetical protein
LYDSSVSGGGHFLRELKDEHGKVLERLPLESLHDGMELFHVGKSGIFGSRTPPL